uniref:Uncharacterized protein n=1 Tax=Arundo donax TaxID=35708 RepID=A0A0A9AFF8_ARUDO
MSELFDNGVIPLVEENTKEKGIKDLNLSVGAINCQL